MKDLEWILGAISGASLIIASLWYRYLNTLQSWNEESQTPPEPQNAPPSPVPLVPPPLQWDTPRHAFHAVRVLCDEAGLTLDEKNLICAVIYQESMFNNLAKNRNKNAKGDVLSVDYGLCQINSHYHVGPGKDFPSVEFVLNNPAEVVTWMISMYKHGKLKMWVGFSSGAYLKWLSTFSPMWLLKT